MSWDAFFFAIDWNQRDRMKSNFWEECLDQDCFIKPQHLTWVRLLKNFKDYIGHWDVASEANDIYEMIRIQLSSESRIQLDYIISNLFSNSFCEYWKDFEEQEAPEREWLAQIDFSYCLSPEEIDKLLMHWTGELKEEIKRVYPFRENPRFILSVDDFLWYLEAWISLLREVSERLGWGLIWVISY